MDAPEPVEVTVTAAGYPTEVTCKLCRNLMLPEDAEGEGWVCHVCDRRILVRLVRPGS